MMSVEEKKDFKELFEIFAEFDTDGNGSISIQVPHKINSNGNKR